VSDIFLPGTCLSIKIFSVNGRPAHVAKLRSEFDTGADYRLVEAEPGDLDPHAVASIFKAYLRERT
jgi:hypothetical protein